MVPRSSASSRSTRARWLITCVRAAVRRYLAAGSRYLLTWAPSSGGGCGGEGCLDAVGLPVTGAMGWPVTPSGREGPGEFGKHGIMPDIQSGEFQSFCERRRGDQVVTKADPGVGP